MKGSRDSPRIIQVDAFAASSTGIDEAKEILLSGGLVAFPTESFYGLAVNAMDEEAVGRLFAIKKRRGDRPVLILIHDPEVLGRYVERIPETARRLMGRFWPGGLTMLFKAGPVISPLLTAGTGKIGIRLSSHPLAVALARAIDLPITGTSANISGLPACTRAEEVHNILGRKVDLILDGGKTEGGKGSTILDVTSDPPVINREGMIGGKEIAEVLSLPQKEKIANGEWFR